MHSGKRIPAYYREARISNLFAMRLTRFLCRLMKLGNKGDEFRVKGEGFGLDEARQQR
jgi:hypothetical protein